MGQYGPKKIFIKNQAPSLFKLNNFPSSCKKSEKTNDPILRKAPDRRTDGRTDGRTNGRTDRGQFIGPNLAGRSKKPFGISLDSEIYYLITGLLLRLDTLKLWNVYCSIVRPDNIHQQSKVYFYGAKLTHKPVNV